jgi:hypothetical protein
MELAALPSNQCRSLVSLYTCYAPTRIQANIESIDFTAEMEGYYSVILPQARDVTSTGTAEFDECRLDDDVMQTRIVMDGFAMFDEEENGGDNVLSQDEVHKLVTKETLRDYFKGVCIDMEAFEARILEPNASVKEGMDSSTYWVSGLCNADPVGGIAGATVAGIIIGTLLLVCICMGLFTCCCKKVFCPCC